jgi:CARDB
VRWAGTDDDVFLRLGRGLRFNLDKRLYNDFERDDRDTYSVPIDDAVRRGMRVGDIREVTIEKARDGIAGGWRLGGVKLFVNGRLLYSKRNINRWLEDDRRTFTAPDFVRSAPRGTKLPVWLRLDEDDLIYGSDDQGDINPFDKRRTVAVGYSPGPPLERRTTGGGRHGGRLDDGDEATITYRLETLTPETIREQPQPPPPPPPPPAERPDLVITRFFYNSITVKNQGAGAAGPFRLRAGDSVTSVFESFPGLGPGESATRPLRLTCERSYVALVDDLSRVEETDEANNTKGSEPAIC